MNKSQAKQIPTIWVSRPSMVAVVVFAAALVLPPIASKLSKPCATSQGNWAWLRTEWEYSRGLSAIVGGISFVLLILDLVLGKMASKLILLNAAPAYNFINCETCMLLFTCTFTT